ncbi:MAG: purine-nucleoside phosphorylase [Kiritimatiellae bacterium]|nr:purine-nucleoside phosphorylase [Kiritimatiellia bacterium]
MDQKILDKALAFVKSQWPAAKPKIGLICGSGWSDVVAAFKEKGSLSYGDIPGMGSPGVVGHAGKLAWTELAGVETFVFQGRRHWYEGEGWTPVALPVYLLKQMGARAVVLTNAAGGVRADLTPGTLMIIEDHINLMNANPLLGPHNPAWGPRFPDQSTVYNKELREALERAGKAVGQKLAKGVYLAGSGPLYETPAEIRAWRALGADAVGMSTVPEAQLANAAGLKVLGLSCITNLAAGVSKNPLTHEEVTATTKAAMAGMKTLIVQLWKELSLSL